MRDIRAQLSERYQKDPHRQTEDLRRVHEKYNIGSYQTVDVKSNVAEDESEYGDADS